MSKFGKLSEAFEVNTPREMKLANPITGLPLTSNDGKTAASIQLYSADSKVAQTFERELLDGRLLSKAKPDAEKTETEMYLRIATMTAGWTLFDLDGNPVEVECTRANAVEFYREMPWAFEQAVDFTRSRNNYKKI
jgi:hypothetical protein